MAAFFKAGNFTLLLLLGPLGKHSTYHLHITIAIWGPFESNSTYTLKLLLGASLKGRIFTPQLLLGAPLKSRYLPGVSNRDFINSIAIATTIC